MSAHAPRPKTRRSSASNTSRPRCESSSRRPSATSQTLNVVKLPPESASRSSIHACTPHARSMEEAKEGVPAPAGPLGVPAWMSASKGSANDGRPHAAHISARRTLAYARCWTATGSCAPCRWRRKASTAAARDSNPRTLRCDARYGGPRAKKRSSARASRARCSQSAGGEPTACSQGATAESHAAQVSHSRRGSAMGRSKLASCPICRLLLS